MKLFFLKPTSILIPIALVALIFFNKQLFINFVSTSVLFLSIYFSVISGFEYIKKKKNFDILVKYLPELYPGQTALIEIEISGMNDNLPGYLYYISFGIFEKGIKIDFRLVRLKYERKHVFSFEFTSERHGEFDLKNFQLVTTDIFLFTETVKFSVSELRVLVSLNPSDSGLISSFFSQGGEKPIKSNIMLNSTDFFDVRKYYPGDDLRKINWKIFAHTGELHMREQEKIPPDNGTISFIFSPYSKDVKEYELISGIFYKAVLEFTNIHIPVKIYHPSSSEPAVISNENILDLYTILNNAYIPFYNFANIPPSSIAGGFFSAQSLCEAGTNSVFFENSTIFVSLYNYSVTFSTVKKTLYTIQSSDSIISDMRKIILRNKQSRNKQKKINEKIELFSQKKIKINIIEALV